MNELELGGGPGGAATGWILYMCPALRRLRRFRGDPKNLHCWHETPLLSLIAGSANGKKGGEKEKRKGERDPERLRLDGRFFAGRRMSSVTEFRFGL